MNRKLLVVCSIFMLTACTNNNIVTDEKTSSENIIYEASIKENIKYPLIIKPTSGEISLAYQSEGIFCIYTGEKFGFVKENGTEITPYVYNFAYPFSEGFTCVMKDGKYGFIDTQGKTIIDSIYDDVSYFQNGLAIVRKINYMGIIDKNGKEIIPIGYNHVQINKDGLIATKDSVDTHFDFWGTIFEVTSNTAFLVYDNHTIFGKNKNEYLSLDWMRASIEIHSYDDNFLLENVHLFYDPNGNHLSKENILEAEYILRYSINSKLVTEERYDNELEKYDYIPMVLSY